MCKILYYQVNLNTIKLLSEKYNIVLLLRNPFDSFISFQIAAILKRYHNFGEERVIPKIKINVHKNIMINHVTEIINYNLNMIPIASKIFTYNEIINDWYNSINYFTKILNGKEISSDMPINKNPEDPRDFITNYQELKDIYEKFYSGLV